MFALVLAAAAADTDFDRLFGATPAAEPVEVTQEAPAVATASPAGPSTGGPDAYAPPEIPGWAFSVGALGLGGMAMLWLKKRASASAAAPLTVLHRQPIGDRSSLVLIEVMTPDGERRRLLIGTGGGVPSLVSDLGGGFDDLVGANQARTAPTAPPAVPVAPLSAAQRAANIAEEVLNERRNRGRWLAVAGDDE